MLVNQGTSLFGQRNQGHRPRYAQGVFNVRCHEKSHQTRDPHLRANLEAYVDVLCNKLKLHHQSLGTYNTAEALEEQRRNSPPARPALGEMCPRNIADAIGARRRRSVRRNGAERRRRRREHVPHSTASNEGRPRICPG